MTTARLKIAVVGAGVGGLALACLAARQGHGVCLWERFEQPRPVGSGLVIQPVGLAVLDELGLGAAARALGAPIARMQGHLGNGRAVLDVSYRRDAPGLRATDQAGDAAPRREAELGQLRGLARTGFTAHDDDLVLL